ncbi:hypothetical protein JKA74_17065 [Marivirga sp. S37H4]|uniref:Prenyltransferase n=1 Tax=Marivirga aurantiaca TaxID=2802615 RepID=A0A935CDC0_9BACT|nr:hypothetical protein [Marivirga aurantiaca]MBK6266758.1 hypothetical protein [Marivirga aurantiaca]
MFSKAYQYIRAFSLDVVAGAAISARWIGNYFGAEIPFSSILALSLTVWLIYTVDHLLDARKIRPNEALFRHFIHLKIAPYIIGLVIVAILLLIYTIQYLKAELIWYGLGLGAAVIIYLVLVHFIGKKPYWGKEWFISIVYATGICLPTYANLGEFPLILGYFWIQLFMLASINLLMFNMFEYKQDKLQGFNSFATVWGFDISRKVILALFLFFTIIWSVAFLLFKQANFLDYQAILIFMGSVLAMVLSKESALKEEEWYRVIGDIVFVLPLIELLIDG